MSGYGEASGQLVFEANEELKQALNTSKDISNDFIDLLTKHFALDQQRLANMGFGINDKKIKDGLIVLDIFDGSWIEIAKAMIHSKSGLHVAGKFWDDYGGEHYVAGDGNGELVSFYYEEESDEMFQEGFDEEAYELEHQRNIEKWNGLVPTKFKGVMG